MDDSELRAALERNHVASYGWALHCCAHDPQLAEDVLQTVYLKVLDGRARYDGRAAFQTWLFAVIRCTAADERRKSFLRKLCLMEYLRQERSATVENDAAHSMDSAQTQAWFRETLSRLPKRQQEILHLVFYQDMSVQQASEVMGVSVGSARTHYERGKQRLREWIEESERFDERRSTRRTDQATV